MSECTRSVLNGAYYIDWVIGTLADWVFIQLKLGGVVE